MREGEDLLNENDFGELRKAFEMAWSADHAPHAQQQSQARRARPAGLSAD